MNYVLKNGQMQLKKDTFEMKKQRNMWTSLVIIKMYTKCPWHVIFSSSNCQQMKKKRGNIHSQGRFEYRLSACRRLYSSRRPWDGNLTTDKSLWEVVPGFTGRKISKWGKGKSDYLCLKVNLIFAEGTQEDCCTM